MKEASTIGRRAAGVVKHAAREVLPPIALRAAHAMRAWAASVRALEDTGFGRRIAHRGGDADRTVVRQVFVNRDYDLARFPQGIEIQRFYERCATPLIVDCGANIGAASVWFASTYPKAQVLAVEPDAGNFALLERNTSGLEVRCVRAAIGGRPGTVRLVDPGEGEWGYRTVGAGVPRDEVRAFTLADLVASAAERTPFILKIDVEGAEGDLFREAPEVYARFPVVILELHDWMLPRARTSRPFLEWHVAQDRDFVQYGENVFSLCNRMLVPD